MAQNLPEQSPNKTLSELLKAHLRRRGWTAGKLANECGIAKSTVSRIINGKGTRGKPHCPTLESIMAMTRVLRLNAKESQELFYAAYPQFLVWEEAIQKKLDLYETEALLEDRGCPLLSKEAGAM